MSRFSRASVPQTRAFREKKQACRDFSLETIPGVKCISTVGRRAHQRICFWRHRSFCSQLVQDVANLEDLSRLLRSWKIIGECLTEFRSPFTKDETKIRRGDLRRLAPRKKLLKSCADSSESLCAFQFLTHTAVLSIATQTERRNCDDYYARIDREG
jgi:hypothetical protein